MTRSVGLKPLLLRACRAIVCTIFEMRASWTVNIIGLRFDGRSAGTVRFQNSRVHIGLTWAVWREGLTHRSLRAGEGDISFGAARMRRTRSLEGTNIRTARLIDSVFEIWVLRPSRTYW
jgi:hypothetical protein